MHQDTRLLFFPRLRHRTLNPYARCLRYRKISSDLSLYIGLDIPISIDLPDYAKVPRLYLTSILLLVLYPCIFRRGWKRSLSVWTAQSPLYLPEDKTLICSGSKLRVEEYASCFSLAIRGLLILIEVVKVNNDY